MILMKSRCIWSPLWQHTNSTPAINTTDNNKQQTKNNNNKNIDKKYIKFYQNTMFKKYILYRTHKTFSLFPGTTSAIITQNVNFYRANRMTMMKSRCFWSPLCQHTNSTPPINTTNQQQTTNKKQQQQKILMFFFLPKYDGGVPDAPK